MAVVWSFDQLASAQCGCGAGCAQHSITGSEPTFSTSPVETDTTSSRSSATVSTAIKAVEARARQLASNDYRLTRNSTKSIQRPSYAIFLRNTGVSLQSRQNLACHSAMIMGRSCSSASSWLGGTRVRTMPGQRGWPRNAEGARILEGGRTVGEWWVS